MPGVVETALDQTGQKDVIVLPKPSLGTRTFVLRFLNISGVSMKRGTKRALLNRHKMGSGAKSYHRGRGQ